MDGEKMGLQVVHERAIRFCYFRMLSRQRRVEFNTEIGNGKRRGAL